MSDLPDNWSETQLGSLIERIEAGLNVKCEERPPQGTERGLVKISAVTWGRFNEEQSKTLPTDIAVSANAQIQAGDLLFSRANTIELVGATVLVEKVEKRLYLSDKVLRLVVPAESKRWINYAMKTAVVRKAIQEASSGNQLSMRNISQEKLRQIPIPLAPLPEQKRIADKLDSVLARVDACRDRLDRLPTLLKRFRQSILAAATSGRLTEDWRKANLAANWRTVRLEEVAKGFSYGSATKSSKSGLVPVLRMGNIQEGGVDWTDLVFTSNPNEIEKYRLVDGDVLFNRTNSPELVGKTAVFKGTREAIYAGYLIRVRCTPQLLPDYLNYCLGSPSGREYCWQVKSDGVSQSNINAKKLAAFKLALPTPEEQTEIVRRVELLFAFADRLEARLATARRQVGQLTPALLAKAFRGELVAQDPADEPAAELLKRLAAQRAATPKVKRGRSPA